MHDPDVQAFTIPRPWPQRSAFSATGSSGDGVRWRMRLHHDCGSWCVDDPPHPSGAFPWWKPGSYSKFWRVAGRDLYWPDLVVVWHREPGGRDSGDVCPHYTRWRKADGTWDSKTLRAWRWHVHHWRIQIPPLQHLRRTLLTRCAWCGGRSVKGDLVNFAEGWHTPRGRWWRGESGLYHEACHSARSAHATCMCSPPGALEHGDYGTCTGCGRFRPWRQGGYRPSQAERLLAATPPRTHPDAATWRQVGVLWEAHRAVERS